MKFTLTIEMQNDSMRKTEQIATALGNIAGTLFLRYPHFDIDTPAAGTIVNLNGDPVGVWEVAADIPVDPSQPHPIPPQPLDSIGK
jgi:hypothetical protein